MVNKFWTDSWRIFRGELEVASWFHLALSDFEIISTQYLIHPRRGYQGRTVSVNGMPIQWVTWPFNFSILLSIIFTAHEVRSASHPTSFGNSDEILPSPYIKIVVCAILRKTAMSQKKPMLNDIDQSPAIHHLLLKIKPSFIYILVFCNI